MSLNTPSSETWLTLIRHGETAWNADGILQGHLPSELSPLGRRQAQAVARRLAAEPRFDAVYSSDLMRSLQTADYFTELRPTAIVREPRLRERSMGAFDGLTWQQVESRFPDQYAQYRTGRLDYAMPEGESSQQVYDRVIACINDLADRHQGRHLLVFTHGGVLHRIFRYVTDSPRVGPRRFSLFNAAINRIRRDPTGWSIETWGDIAHLEDIGTRSDN